MDDSVHDIKTFVSFASVPVRHTAHKTMRVPCANRGQALHRVYKPPPIQCPALGGLLNKYLIAVDIASNREIDLFLSIDHKRDHLTVWHCYIAKYP